MEQNIKFISDQVKKLREETMRFVNMDTREQSRINSKTIEIYDYIVENASDVSEDIVKNITLDLDFIRRKFVLEPLDNLNRYIDEIEKEKPFVIK